MQSNLRTTKEISELLNVTEETVRRWIRSGDLEATLDGKSYLVEEEVLQEFIQKKAKVSGTSISKMVSLSGMAAGAAAISPILGAGAAGILGIASLVNKGLKKSDGSKGQKVDDNLSDQTFELKDIEDYIQALHRKRKKIELEYQMKLLEIDDEIANYTTLKEKMEKE